MTETTETSRCYIHDADESVSERAYRVCFECGHVFETRADVVREHEETLKLAPEAHPTNTAETLAGIFCPLCLHDW